MERFSMQHEELLYPKDWLRIAEKDLERTTQLLKLNDPELAGFCLQQSIEKFLKGFLLSKGWKLRRIHNLEALLDDAIPYSESLENYRKDCQKISAFYFLVRYPTVEIAIGKKDIEDTLKNIQGLVLDIRSLM